MDSFKKVVGHTELLEYIRTAVREEMYSHAYIMTGARGSGKRLLSDLFSQALVCERRNETGEPCGACHACVQARTRNHPDIIRVSHTKPGSISVDDIREQVGATVGVKPYSGAHKVYIIDDADLLTEQAQNALLKTIEEPPEYAIFFLLAQNAEALLPTIRSRCVTLKLRNIKNQLIRIFLMEEYGVNEGVANFCAAFAAGNIGQAIMLATSEYFQEVRNDCVRLLTHIDTMEPDTFYANIKKCAEYKLEINDYLDLIAVWYRDLLIYKATKNIDQVIFHDQVSVLKEKANTSSYEGIERILEALDRTKARLRANVSFELSMELLLLCIKEN